jgi:hypothetical protein
VVQGTGKNGTAKQTGSITRQRIGYNYCKQLVEIKQFVQRLRIHIWQSKIYLVAAADHLLHTKGESKESMLTGLAILGDTCLKTTSGGVNDKHSTITLGGTSDHVLDEVTMSQSINDGAGVYQW